MKRVLHAFSCRGLYHVYHVHCLYFGGKLLLTPGVWLASFVVVVAGRLLPLVFGVYLAGLFEYPTVSVGVVSWFIGVAKNLAGPIQYLIQVG